MIARSRLRWFDRDDEAASIEVPNVRGDPVLDAALDGPIARRREWPNRLGVCEPGSDSDEVRWYPELAPAPRSGRIVALRIDGRRCDAPERPPSDRERMEWLRGLVRSASQRRGVVAAARIRAPVCILLTPNGGALPSPPSSAELPTSWGPALGAVPGRLAEFPGGLQLAVTDTVWGHREEYAAAVSEMITGGP